MPKGRIEYRAKKRFLLNAAELFGALGIELSEAQKEAPREQKYKTAGNLSY